MLKYNLGDVMNKEFILLLQEIDIDINSNQLKQFEKYFELLVLWNEKINLTAITDKREVYIKHFYDSLCLVKGIKFSNQTLLDVGSGAGFPSIPLKIIFPELKITVIDSLNKRITFLKDLIDNLGIDIELIHGRVEEYKRKNSFDIVTARAVANLRMLAELCVPFVKKEGVFISLKGPKYEDELKTCTNAFKILKVSISEINKYKIDNNQRVIIILKKNEKTGKTYPRQFSKIKSKPL